MILKVVFLAGCLALAGAGIGLRTLLRRRHVDRWLGSYLVHSFRRGDPRPGEEVHLLLCVADHYEPEAGHPAPEVSLARVRYWADNYPRNLGQFRDSDGRSPRHSFFFPVEEYRPEYLDLLAGLCRAGHGEVEVHLHHDNDTAEALRESLLRFKEVLHRRHGLLGRHRATGEVMYGFIHGNWALNNSHPEGRHCGVEGELEVLRETGCYADFTLPSAPNPAQTRTINSLYYADCRRRDRHAHDGGVPVGRGSPPERALMIVQGPLLFNWSLRKWGILPRMENSCLQGSQTASLARLRLWLRARVQVPQRPDWYFVKLHAHGAPEESHEALLGPSMARFHEELARLERENRHFHFHYVSARELYNCIRAAEAGWRGSVKDALNFELLPPEFTAQTHAETAAPPSQAAAQR